MRLEENVNIFNICYSQQHYFNLVKEKQRENSVAMYPNANSCL